MIAPMDTRPRSPRQPAGEEPEDELEREHDRSFESVGHAFDPTRHEAIATVRGGRGKPGTVVGETGRGYFWNGELLRPARVHVAE
jgi:molecular chaperone GrpE (heat shock protein)